MMLLRTRQKKNTGFADVDHFVADPKYLRRSAPDQVEMSMRGIFLEVVNAAQFAGIKDASTQRELIQQRRQSVHDGAPFRKKK